MFKIISKLLLGKDIKRLDIAAPMIAKSYSPGQFVMVCPEEHAKWIPLTIMDVDTRRGLIRIVFKEQGQTTRILGSIPINDRVFSISGPFGKIQAPKQVGVVVCVASGISAAQILPMCRAYSRAENKVIGVLGARTKSELILESQMRIACHKIMLTTEDGSYQRRGVAEDLVKELIAHEEVRLIYSVGDADMMRNIAGISKKHGIPNLMQVHTVMSCGRGICGSCRVKVGGDLVLSCEEGPEFDGHVMDFDYLKHRMEHACSHESASVKTMEKGVGFFKKIFQSE